MGKICSIDKISEIVKSSDTVMVGGFGLVGSPLKLIEKLIATDVRDLTIISNNLGEQGKGLGKLLLEGKIKKGIGSYFTSNPDVGRLFSEGKVEIELIPQGTFSEAIRAGGAGIGGFYVKTGTGTIISKGKETKIINGEEYIFQLPLKADVSLIKAKKADQLGNLIYEKTARNFNPIMATAAKTVIVEVDEIVEVGELRDEEIITPHLYIDWIVSNR